jgi:membrane-associated phospholipid phosphatase
MVSILSWKPAIAESAEGNMKSTTHPKGIQTPTAQTTAGGENRQAAHKRPITEAIVWGLGFVILIIASVSVHAHPGPWPVELAFTRTVQGLPYWPWIPPILDFIGTFDNPTPTGIVLGIVFTGILLMGWYRQAIFLALTVGIGNAMNAFIGDYVVRPRPTLALVHVDVSLKYNSFPSGHCCHVMLFYGFLLYLSFTRPVRRWRYRWALVPLQVFAALNSLLIGFSRVYEGEHWLFDVLSGYLSGALWLVLFICLYQWTTSVLDRRHAKRAGFTFLEMDEFER